MTIRYAILGLLGWRPSSGYDLKKLIAAAPALYWSGNNNQVYTTLVQMNREGLVEYSVETQESLPAKKVYSLTPSGQAELRAWVQGNPEPPELRSTFLVQLCWADLLSPEELDELMASYENEVYTLLLMKREQARRTPSPNRTPREAYLWRMAAENLTSSYENELTWVRRVREGLKEYD